jgi:ferredoxin, 2Fe-2S
MPKIIYIEHPEHGGQQHVQEASPGQSVMEVAVKNAVPGIEAICGGSCACATCHVYVDPDWAGRAGQASDMEKSMLELVADIHPTSRLACQITMTCELDGLIVRLPKTQGQ